MKNNYVLAKDLESKGLMAIETDVKEAEVIAGENYEVGDRILYIGEQREHEGNKIIKGTDILAVIK